MLHPLPLFQFIGFGIKNIFKIFIIALENKKYIPFWSRNYWKFKIFKED